MTFLFKKPLAEVRQELAENPEKAKDLFYDWFCSRRGLKNRGLKLINKANFILSQLNIPEDKVTLTFKNNCPLYGTLYDSFFIDTVDGKSRIYIVPSYGHNSIKGQAALSVITYDNKGAHEKLNKTFCNWRNLKKEIKNDVQLRTNINEYFEEK